MNMTVGVDFRGAGGRCPLGSDNKGGEICLAPSFFLASNTHLATRNPKLRTEVEREYGEDLFFWSSPEFEGKISK